MDIDQLNIFPSPDGAWIVTLRNPADGIKITFPSPDGAWIVTGELKPNESREYTISVP